MLVPIIKVRDKYSKNEHIVGQNHHDKLVVNEEGQLHYVNWQCMDGTGADEGYGYEFVGYEIPIDEYSTETHVEMMDAEKYIKVLQKMIEEEKKNDIELRKTLGIPDDAIIIS